MTVSAAELTVSPTTITRAQITNLVPGPNGMEIAIASLTFSNSSNVESLEWKISGYFLSATYTANPIAPKGSSVVQIKFYVPAGTRSFEVIGPVNTVTVSITLSS